MQKAGGALGAAWSRVLAEAVGTGGGLWVRAEVGSVQQLPVPIPEVSSHLLANSIQSEVLLLNEVTATHLPAGLSSQWSPPCVSIS